MGQLDGIAIEAQEIAVHGGVARNPSADQRLRDQRPDGRRQFEPMERTISDSDGLFFFCSRATPVMIMPEVQYPHCMQHSQIPRYQPMGDGALSGD